MSTQPLGAYQPLSTQNKILNCQAWHNMALFTLNSLTHAFSINMLRYFHLCLTRYTSLFSYDKPWNSAFSTVKYKLLRSWLYVVHTHIKCSSFSTYYKLQIKHILSSTFFYFWRVLFLNVMGDTMSILLNDTSDILDIKLQMWFISTSNYTGAQNFKFPWPKQYYPGF